MIKAGDIVLAHLRDETRHRVLVTSDSRFHRLAGRAVVVPEIRIDADELLPQWRIEVEDSVFAVDILRSIPIERLLEAAGRAPVGQFEQVRRAIGHLT